MIVVIDTIVCKAHASLKAARLILNVEQDLFVETGLAYLLYHMDGKIDLVGTPMNVLAVTCNALKLQKLKGTECVCHTCVKKTLIVLIGWLVNWEFASTQSAHHKIHAVLV